MLSHCFNAFRRSARGHLDWVKVFAVFVSALFLIPNAVTAQNQINNLAIVVNGLSKPEVGISPSLSIVNLDEPDAARAVANGGNPFR